MKPIGCKLENDRYLTCIECRQEYNNDYCRMIHLLGCVHIFDDN